MAMKKTTIITFALLLGFFAACFLVLRTYKLDLVQTIVVNAVTQKAPPSYPERRIHRAFSKAREQARRRKRKGPYLEQLLRISQRLEKVQALNEKDLQQLLEELSD